MGRGGSGVGWPQMVHEVLVVSHLLMDLLAVGMVESQRRVDIGQRDLRVAGDSSSGVMP